mmetsp:Transcript_35588/g.49649  ORF Transcript_35588/g.49649 Transcript_35588/m.49649 type:complete len:194 (-) Transcript_35588:21-602(-)
MPVAVLQSQDVVIPADVQIKCRKRKVTITGVRGTLHKEFTHAAIQLKLLKSKKGTVLRVELWHGNRKAQATVRTVCSHVQNMITGVRLGYKYELKFVYAHFPINVNISPDGKRIEVRNFIGNRNSLVLNMLHGCTVRKAEEKDTIEVLGNSLDRVSQSAASIQQAAQVKNKDIRKFLDGIYVSKKSNITVDEE